MEVGEGFAAEVGEEVTAEVGLGVTEVSDVEAAFTARSGVSDVHVWGFTFGFNLNKFGLLLIFFKL